MAQTIPLDEMTIEEKIQMMESIWTDLCSQENHVKSPAWHNEELMEREKAIQQGQDEFVDWSEAKKAIKNKIT